MLHTNTIWPYELLGTQEQWIENIKSWLELYDERYSDRFHRQSPSRHPNRQLEFSDDVRDISGIFGVHPSTSADMSYCGDCQEKLKKVSGEGKCHSKCPYPLWAFAVDEKSLRKEFTTLGSPLVITGIVHYGDIKKRMASRVSIHGIQERVEANLEYRWIRTSENTFFRPIKPILCSGSQVSFYYTEPGLSMIGLSYARWRREI